MFTNITGRKSAEDKLIESEEKFRNISEQNIMGVCVLQDNVIKYTNKAMADLYGYTVEEVLNWKPGEFFKLFTQETLKLAKEQAAKKQTGDPDQLVKYNVHGIKKNGELIWASNYSKTIIYEGRPADLVTQVDITERKQAEDALHENEEKFRNLMEQSPLSIQFFNVDGKIAQVNEAWKKLWGIADEDWLMSLKTITYSKTKKSKNMGFCRWYKKPSGGRTLFYQKLNMTHPMHCKMQG